ncbi:hypothetical protein Ccrd_000876 [Cynara cardunculus var. scolymus]|uniref:Uncharacterized protein n=1 Tax=Cynara cardunculus var. scolymus TaxID=59895 RepID=A0A118JXV4_CYNCS|nr:hypothetical protein Ccrd_000876 [Cynara cardunculus var. scolymus]
MQKGSFLCALLSPSSAGLGGTDAPQVRSRKSMSNERTFSATKDEAFFYQKLGQIHLKSEKDIKLGD